MTARWIGRALLVAVSLASAEARADTLTEQQIITSLQGPEAITITIDPVVLAQVASANVGRGVASAKEWAQLTGLSQLTVEINFEYNSVAMVPELYRAIGLMADALHHPLLLGNRFLVVGHTDAKGDPKYNLALSQKRADAIVEALTTTFSVAPNRLVAVGVGEELPLDAAHPDAAINRRVQLFNIGSVK